MVKGDSHAPLPIEVMKLINGQLYGNHGFIGQIQETTLRVMTETDKISVCAHAIMEHGGAFAELWVYDTRSGDIHYISRDELRRQPCDEEDQHILKIGDNLTRITEDDYRSNIPI